MNKILFITLSFFSCMAAGEATKEIPKEIPKDIAPVLTAYESDAKKAWDIYQAALQKAEDKAKKDLNAKMAPALKKGDLDTANAIKAQLDRVTSGDAVAEYEAAWNAAKKDTDLLGDVNGLVILEATWGIANRTIDVKDFLQGKIKNNTLSIANEGSEITVRDPAFGISKVLTVKYAYGGKVHTVNIREHEVLNIPAK